MLKLIAVFAVCALSVAAEREESHRSKRSSGLIINGRNAGKGNYPQFAVIFLQGEFLCGGTILNKKSILTAAHCLFSNETSDYTVAVGKYRLNRDDGDEQYFDVRSITLGNYSFPMDDIAIIRLKGKMTYNEYVQPVQLARSPKDENFTSCYVIGMGSSSETIIDDEPDYGDPKVLQELATEVQSRKRCKRLQKRYLGEFLRPKEYTKDFICTLDQDSGACYGDSGGPVGCVDAEGTFVQMGILSYGSIYCIDGFNVYTRVSQYRDWIKENM